RRESKNCRNPLVMKSRFDFRRGHHTHFFPAEPTIAVTGYCRIDRVSHHSRHEQKYPENPPCAGEASYNFDSSVTTQEHSPICNKHESLKVRWIQTMTFKDL